MLPVPLVLLSLGASSQPPSAAPCIVADSAVEHYVDYAQRLAEPDGRKDFHLAAFDSAEVEVVRDAAFCRRMASAYRVRAGKVRKEVPSIHALIVIRLGHAGYLVSAPEDWSHAGEFLCDAVLFDAKLRYREHLCG